LRHVARRQRLPVAEAPAGSRLLLLPVLGMGTLLGMGWPLVGLGRRRGLRRSADRRPLALDSELAGRDGIGISGLTIFAGVKAHLRRSRFRGHRDRGQMTW